jgi:hypothetical protein
MVRIICPDSPTAVRRNPSQWPWLLHIYPSFLQVDFTSHNKNMLERVYILYCKPRRTAIGQILTFVKEPEREAPGNPSAWDMMQCKSTISVSDKVANASADVAKKGRLRIIRR